MTFGNANLNVPITFAGPGTLVGISTLTMNDTAGIYFTGRLTDVVSNPGQLVLTGAAGSVVVQSGTGYVSNGAGQGRALLGSGPAFDPSGHHQLGRYG